MNFFRCEDVIVFIVWYDFVFFFVWEYIDFWFWFRDLLMFMFWEIVIVEIKVVIFVIKGEDVFIFVGENKVSFDEDINIFEVEGVCFLRLEDVFKFSIFDGVNLFLICEDIGIFIEDENGKEEFNFFRIIIVVLIFILCESFMIEDVEGIELFWDIFISEDLL